MGFRVCVCSPGCQHSFPQFSKPRGRSNLLPGWRNSSSPHLTWWPSGTLYIPLLLVVGPFKKKPTPNRVPLSEYGYWSTKLKDVLLCRLSLELDMAGFLVLRLFGVHRVNPKTLRPSLGSESMGLPVLFLIRCLSGSLL